MAVTPEQLTVTLNERESVSAMLYAAAKQDRIGITVLLGHGAGADQNSPFMRMISEELAARGFDAMTFNFSYMEQGRRSPDPKAKLESCYSSAIHASQSHKKLKNNHLVIGGKSMGGRIASQVAAADGGNIAGLMFLGYPLHPPGKHEQMRDAHLKNIRAPMLFVQGSRDAFGTPEELRTVIKRDRLPAAIYVVEGGDHSFKVPKTAKVSQKQVYEDVLNEIVDWSRKNLGD